MANTIFQQNTPVTVEWLNEVNRLVWRNFTFSTGVGNTISKMKMASALVGVSGDFYEAAGVSSVVDLGAGSFRVVWEPGLFLSGQYAVVAMPYTQGFSCSVITISPVSVDIVCADVAGVATDGLAYSVIAMGRGA
jgi:hypothetical protein